MCLSLHNTFSHHRDALMEGMFANAGGREAKGLARMALARYMQKKADFAQSVKREPEKPSTLVDDFDNDGKPIKTTYIWPKEIQGYVAGLRMIDPDSLRKHAESLYEGVITDYGDIPYITSHQRYLETLLKDPVPMWNYRPMTSEEIAKCRAMVEKTKDARRGRRGEPRRDAPREGRPRRARDRRQGPRRPTHEALRLPAARSSCSSSGVPGAAPAWRRSPTSASSSKNTMASPSCSSA